MSRCVFVLVMMLGVNAAATAHDDPSDRIHALTHEIEQTPEEARLYVARAQQYRADERWDAALADFATALRLDPDRRGPLHSLRAEVLVLADRPHDALCAADRSLEVLENWGPARLARARALAMLDRKREAAEEYALALATLADRRPVHYLEQAQALVAVGTPKAKQDALDALDLGMADLGPVIALALEAIEIEKSREDWDGALGRIDAIAARAQRQEPWMMRRGEIFEAAGRYHDARAAYESVLATIDALPPRHRNTGITRDLEARARARLAALAQSE